MQIVNPCAYWVLALGNARGQHYIKSKDWPELAAWVLSQLRAEPGGLSLLSPADRLALEQAGLLSAQQWQPPQAVYLVIYTSLKYFGTRPFVCEWKPETRAFLECCLKLLAEPEQELAPLEPEWRRQLQQMGLLAEASLIPEPVYLNALSLEQAMGLIPYSQRLEADQELESVSVLKTLNQPAQGMQEWTQVFEPESELLWLRDPVYGLRQPLAAYAWLQKALELPRAELVAEQLRLLQAGYFAQPLATPQASFRELGQRLQQQNYLVLYKLFAPLFLASIRYYLRQRLQAGYFQLNQSKIKGRDGSHNDPLMKFLHLELTKLLNQFLPEPVKASYSYLALYHGGASLPRHTDRELCAWNLSLVLDLEPETEGTDSWPIYLEPQPGQVQKIHLEIGDGLLYQGTRYPHWREALALGHRASVCFFHFVPQDYIGFLY